MRLVLGVSTAITRASTRGMETVSWVKVFFTAFRFCPERGAAAASSSIVAKARIRVLVFMLVLVLLDSFEQLFE